MGRGRLICELIHAAALGLWLGSLVLAATAAAIIFPTLRGLNPGLPDFSGYSGEHWLIAGGQVAARIFWAADVAQFACMLIAGVTFGAAVMWLGVSTQRWSTLVRVTLLLSLVAVLSYRLGFLEPSLTTALRGHWAAAAAGNNAQANELKAVFDKGHPTQTRLLAVTAGLVFASMVAGIWSVAREPRIRDQGAS